MITVTHEFAGFGDYWGGNGRRNDRNAGCLFAYYGPGTTLKDCVDQWVEDYWNGGDFEHYDDGPDAFEDVTQNDIRGAILSTLLNEQGRADYHNGVVCEFAARLEDDRCCAECDEPIGEPHHENCEYLTDYDGDETCTVLDEDCEESDCDESPIWVILVEIEVCSDCKKAGDHYIDDLCKDCSKEQHPDYFDECGEYIA